MNRYLTPSKIGLLTLASIYSEGVVPTSETVSVLSFLIIHILPILTTSPPHQAFDTDDAVSVGDFERVLFRHASAIPGRTVWDLFLKRIWSLNCSDALDLFITNIPLFLKKSHEQTLKDRENGGEEELDPGRISRTSPLGAFVRRCHLEYTRLQFQDGIALWQEFIAFRAPTRQAWEKKNLSDDRSALDVNLSDLGIDASHPLSQIVYGRLATGDNLQNSLSNYDIEKLVEFQVSELQRLGGRLPEGMKIKLDGLCKSGVTVPSLAHYLTFLDSWRAGDYVSAFENLHRYFDYTMQSRDRTFYQYALLNLAILQADFGCHSEAIPAMQEAIATARENKDTTCLNFCMSWLYHFGRSFPVEMREIRESGILGSEIEGLTFLKTRAKDAEMWSLLSSCLLSEAKLGLQHGDSLAAVFENIAKASHLNVTKGVNNVIAPTLLMRGSVYGRIGLAHMGWLAGETFLECFSDDASVEDNLKCRCRMASILVQKGRYEDATEMMESTQPHILKVLKYRNYWSFYMGLLKLRRFLHRHDIDAAVRLHQRLKDQGAPDIEVGLTLSLLEIDLLMRRAIFDEAINSMELLAQKLSQGSSDILSQIKLLCLKARALAKCGHPLKGFSIAIRAANMAYHSRVLPALWEASGLLSNILIELDEFSAATKLLENIIPQVSQCQDCDLIARTYAHLVDAQMGLAGKEDANSTKRNEIINKAIGYVESSLEQFGYAEDLQGQTEMLAKKAKIMYWRGDLVLANNVASQYLQLKKDYKATEVFVQS